jgi:hypothetical protein
MERNLLVHYRENPGKLNSDSKLNGFFFSFWCSAAIFGFGIAMAIHILSVRTAAREAGGEAAQPYPVHLNFVKATFMFVACFMGAAMSWASWQRLQLTRDILEEQLSVSSKRSDTTAMRLLGIPAGAVLGGIIAMSFLLRL